ncbi:MFS transporter [Bacillus sp. KH172YL63]|uniref:MFS transporter n=1 Tax=Bacillus sp. KH172YL63 TaxID=2709784 RepID=UPI0013E425DB|nr:MFS transporter [Bacillus sp. KH172YL63]BCB04796.1 MFS transporter [Bacillus sp. KH172YL63]
MTSEHKTLFQNKSFMKFWIGQTISMFGSQISVMALPLTAVLIFDASPMEMGIYMGMATAPYLVIGLFAGVWVDRVRRRPLMLTSNLLSAAILSLIPVLAWLDLLTISLMYIILFLFGSTRVVFELAYLSFIPSIVGQNEIADANSKIHSTVSVAKVAGPSLAGFLISLVTAPFAILIDSVSFIVSYFVLRRIPVEEPLPKVKTVNNIWKEIGLGLKTIFTHRILLSLSASTATINFFHTTFSAVFMIFLVKNVHLTPLEIGLVMSIGSIGTLIGAFTAKKVSDRIGIGPSIIGSTISIVLGTFIIFSTPTSVWIALPLLAFGQFFTGFGNTVYLVNQVSLRQSITPNNLLGKVNASSRFLTRGVMPIAGLFGGVIGTLFGLRTALLITVLGYTIAVLWLIFSPVKTVRTIEDINHQKNKLSEGLKIAK